MTVKSVPEFLVDATNVYRTKGYIVKQQITLHDSELGSYLLSRDTYYRCTDKRDREFEEAFAYRININGKRMPTSMHIRNISTDKIGLNGNRINSTVRIAEEQGPVFLRCTRRNAERADSVTINTISYF